MDENKVTEEIMDVTDEEDAVVTDCCSCDVAYDDGYNDGYVDGHHRGMSSGVGVGAVATVATVGVIGLIVKKFYDWKKKKDIVVEDLFEDLDEEETVVNEDEA